MPYVFEDKMVQMKVPIGIICNRCGKEYPQVFASLRCLSEEFEIETVYCEQCYFEIVAGDTIQPQETIYLKK